MKLEEAIDILAESKRQNEVMRDNPSTFWASHQIKKGGLTMERLTKRLPNGVIHVDFAKQKESVNCLGLLWRCPPPTLPRCGTGDGFLKHAQV